MGMAHLPPEISRDIMGALNLEIFLYTTEMQHIYHSSNIRGSLPSVNNFYVISNVRLGCFVLLLGFLQG